MSALELAVRRCDETGAAHRLSRLVTMLSAHLLPGAPAPTISFEALAGDDVAHFIAEPRPVIAIDPRAAAGEGKWPGPGADRTDLLEASVLLITHELAHYAAHRMAPGLDDHGPAYQRAVAEFSRQLGLGLPPAECSQWPFDRYAACDGTAGHILRRAKIAELSTCSPGTSGRIRR